jgi:uncharacterized protein (DUF2235 family)
MDQTPSEGRNLVVCFDGTNNEFGREPTNVVRLIEVLDRDRSKRQRLYYDPGIGTLPEPGILTPALKTLTEWFGLAFGLGLSRKVAQAYTYLMDFWETNDRVFLFGFSRGAYTARVLAGLLHQVGLLPRGNYNLIPYALKYFRRITEGHHHQSEKIDASKWKKLCDDFRHTFAREIIPGDDDRRFKVHFLGVWETVSSIGWIWDPKHFPYTAYNPSVEYIRHAVSIDERRAFFRQNLFHPAQGQNVLELWFPGVHSDVGGGFAAECGRLWWNSFKWMQEQAASSGLYFDQDKLAALVADKPQRPWVEQINSSFRPAFWYVGEVWPKLTYCPKFDIRYPRCNFGRRRQVHQGALIDQAALERIRDADLRYTPRNMPATFISTVKALAKVPPYLAIP